MWTKNREIRLKRPALIRGGTNDGVKGREDGLKNAKESNRRGAGQDARTVDRWDGGKGSWSI